MAERKRPAGRPFQPGNPGRPKGTPNKVTREIREAARQLVDDPAYLERLQTRLIEGKAPHMETLLWHYAYGKPTETVALSDGEGGPVVVRFTWAEGTSHPPAGNRESWRAGRSRDDRE